VRTLRAALQARGLVVFVSEADVGIGDNLHGSIAHALDSCTLFVPVASQSAAARAKYALPPHSMAQDKLARGTHSAAPRLPALTPLLRHAVGSVRREQFDSVWDDARAANGD
jgi:hypothetical protein